MKRIAGIVTALVAMTAAQAAMAGGAGASPLRADGNAATAPGPARNAVDEHGHERRDRQDRVKNDRSAIAGTVVDHEAKSAKLAAVAAPDTLPVPIATSAAAPVLSLAPVCLNSYCGATTGQGLAIQARPQPVAMVKKG